MNTIDIKSKYDSEYNCFSVTWIIKSIYQIKLCYPEGIEIDIPRTYRSIYTFGFNIEYYTAIFSKHWEWLIKSIQENYPYEILFNNYEGRSSIKHENQSIIFAVCNEIDTESSYYLPLEYVKDDFIKACTQMIQMYPNQRSVIIQNLDENNQPIDLTGSQLPTESQLPTKYKNIRQILDIHPKNFPVFVMDESSNKIIYCLSHSNIRTNLPLSREHIKPLYDWLNSNDKQCNINTLTCYKGKKHLKIRETTSGLFGIENEHVEKLKDFLSKYQV